jgi:hypothetical protein
VEELHDWCCWSRWYATSNNPHQEDRLSVVTGLPVLLRKPMAKEPNNSIHKHPRRGLLGNPYSAPRIVMKLDRG